MRGRTIPLLPSRRVQNDFLYFANRTPILPVQRRMALGALLEARKTCPHRPPWTALFLRAYAILAQEMPEPLLCAQTFCVGADDLDRALG